MHRPLPTTREEGQELYDEIHSLWETNLKPHGIHLPGFDTHGSWIIVYLYCHLQQEVHKSDVSRWIREKWIPEVSESQIRHLGSQGGWNFYIGGFKRPDGKIVSGGKRSGVGILWDIETVAPHWKNHRRDAVKRGDWEDILKAFDHRCATCGSPEGETNYRNPSLITRLQKGHMVNEFGSNMASDNIIPQCLECNQAYRDKVNFNETGLVSSLSSTELVRKSSEEMRRKIYQELKEEFDPVDQKTHL
jgi:hypothetical protein